MCLLGVMVEDLELQVGDTRNSVSAIAGPDHNGDSAPHVILKMYGEWIDRHARACKLALDAGVEERQVQIAEELGQTLARVVSSVLAELDLSAEQRAKAVSAR